MTWKRAPIAAAVADLLATLDPAVTVFASPPETFNAPAYIVGYPRTVNYRQRQFGSDIAIMPMLAARGLPEADQVDGMLTAAYDAIATYPDPTFGGICQVIDPGPQENWRVLRVSGVDLIAGDLLLEITM